MSFIGIFTESKKETELKQGLKKYFESINQFHTIITINNKNIDNIKNVKFDIIILDVNVLGNTQIVQKLIINAKIIIINTDSEMNLKCIKNLKLRLISYGLNSKSTVTVSSVSEDMILVSLQRSIIDIKDNIIEPQELKIKTKYCHGNLNFAMILVIFSKIFNKI